MRKRNIGLFILICLWLAVPIQATVLIPKDFNDLTLEADLVFVGTVIDIICEWKDPDETEIYTLVTFDDLEIVAGEFQDSEVTVRFSGGEIGDVKIEYAGVPQFNLGQRNLLFLSGNFFEVCPTVGWIQGNFRVIYDPSVGAQVIHTSDGKPIAGIQEGKIILSREDTIEENSSPGVPDESHAQVEAVTGPPVKMTLNAFNQAVQHQRLNHKTKGAVLGYPFPDSKSHGIPVDAMNPNIEASINKAKVIGYDMSPQPVQNATIVPHEE